MAMRELRLLGIELLTMNGMKALVDRAGASESWLLRTRREVGECDFARIESRTKMTSWLRLSDVLIELCSDE